jgi:hypothetical protein
MSTFDYTSRDYASIQTDLLARASSYIPEWTARDQSDFGMMMVDLWAYMGDILHYYVDRAAQESFINTATKRESVMAIANLLDYVPKGRKPARTSITLNAQNTTATDSAPIYIPQYTRFLATPLLDTASPVIFTLNTPVAFVATSSGASANLVVDGVTYSTYPKTTPVSAILTEGERFTETYTATGLAGQQIKLRQTGVVTESITVDVSEGASGADVRYTYIDRMSNATNNNKVYTVNLLADNYSVVTFGGGINGKIPNVNSTITITYRRSRGSAGNVNVGAVYGIESYTVPNKPSLDGLVIVPNTTKAVGGSDPESMDSIRLNAPAMFRTQDRAVSLQDYKDLVKRVPGIVRSTAYLSGTTVLIRATTTPSDYGSTNTLVLTTDEVQSIVDYLEPREITFVTSTVGASVTLTPVNLVGTVQIKSGYIQEVVYDNVVTAVKNLLSFDNVDFGGSLSLGDVYRAILAVDGVDYTHLTRFTTTGSNVIDTSGTFIGVSAGDESMLVFSTTSTFTITPSGGIVASGA